MGNVAFLKSQNAYVIPSANLKTRTNFGDGNWVSIPSGDRNRPEIGDEMWILGICVGSTGSLSFSGTYASPAAWELYDRTTLNVAASRFLTIELWKFNRTTMAWADAAPTVTPSGTTEAYVQAFAIRTERTDNVKIESALSSGSSYAITQNVTAVGNDIYCFAVFANYGSTSVQNPASGWGSSLDGVVLGSAFGISQSAITNYWYMNGDSAPPSLPVFSRQTAASPKDFYWMVFSARKPVSTTTGSGWSVGRMAY